MQTRFSFAASLVSAALFTAGCHPPKPAVAGAPVEEDDDDDVGEGPRIREISIDVPIVQSSAPPTDGRPAPLPTVLKPDARLVAPAGFSAGGFTTADVSAPTTGPVLEGGRLGHDPQVAASDRHLIVYTAHRYRMYDKATGAPLAAEGEITPNGDFNGLFSPLWLPRDHTGAPSTQNINTRLNFALEDPLRCDPEHPTASNACVQEFYDTRILWDAHRRRFWVESAARNHLWYCKPGNPCGPTQSPTQARRYIAIAVSKTEDPRQGFHRYILVNQYSDWPKIGIDERYLILGHRGTSTAYVFDADKLAAGNPDHGPVRLAKLTARAFPGVRHLAPVTAHGPTGGVTYLLGSDGSDSIRVFGLWSPDPNRPARPKVLIGPKIDIDQKLGTIEGNAVYRNGMLHWTRDQWAPDHEKEYRQVRVTRMPLRLAPAEGERPPHIWATNDARFGFLDVVIGERERDDGPGEIMDYEKPALDVNDVGDIVVVYSRKSYRARVAVPPEMRYSIIYHGELRARPGVLVRRGTTSQVPDINDNAKAGIDLAFAQVDPSDDHTVWITHAVADARMRWYRQIVAAVRP
ncbi:Hypothetical protein A7982_03700 [Minicystis rosea]|nr:Hypothetical protein A7982_03700 [Minicystis rosea]